MYVKPCMMEPLLVKAGKVVLPCTFVIMPQCESLLANTKYETQEYCLPNAWGSPRKLSQGMSNPA